MLHILNEEEIRETLLCIEGICKIRPSIINSCLHLENYVRIFSRRHRLFIASNLDDSSTFTCAGSNGQRQLLKTYRVGCCLFRVLSFDLMSKKNCLFFFKQKQNALTFFIERQTRIYIELHVRLKLGNIFGELLPDDPPIKKGILSCAKP